MTLDPLSELADFIQALSKIYSDRKRAVLGDVVSCPMKSYETMIALHATYNALHEAERAIDLALHEIRIDKEEND